MSRGVRLGAVLLAAVGWGACYALDPFLYARVLVNQYSYTAEGGSPEESVPPGSLEPVTLEVEDGVRLGAVYVKSPQQPPRAHVLYFHGICCNLDVHVDRPKRLANLGYDVLVFDYRGWGMSTNVPPTEAGLLADSRAALGWLSARAGLPPERLVYYGRSFGTAVATQLAAHHPPTGLVLESPFSSVEGLMRDSSHMDLPAGFLSQSAWDTEGRLRALEGVPLLLLHGTEDDFVRPEFSDRLYAVAREPKRLVRVDGANHDDIPARMGSVAYARTLESFLADIHTQP
ncbi:alpha/beta hydrolase [Melittangium boletus]|uniref:alpha/beta hydrolase n=1 Tax=Melittangium boletus TaxID=83453 RepID=UPI003DA3741E